MTRLMGPRLAKRRLLGEEQAEVLVVRGRRREFEQLGHGHAGDPSVLDREAHGVQPHALHQRLRIDTEGLAELDVAVQCCIADQWLQVRTPRLCPQMISTVSPQVKRCAGP